MKITPLLHKLFGTTPSKGVQPKEAIAYSIAGFGQNFICTIIGSYLTVFMTDALLFGSDGVSVGAVSGAMAVAFLMLGTRIFDAFNDPIMGSIVDRTRTKWGKCRPYLKWTAIPIGIMTLLCFCPFFEAKSTKTFVIISIVYVVWSVVYTICDVPYWALSTNLTNDTVVRGNILTVARLICTLGAGIVTVGVPIITSAVTAKYKYTDSPEHIAMIMQRNSVTAEGAQEFVGRVMPEFIAENANTLKWTYFICAAVFVLIAMPLFFYGFKNTKERFTTNDAPPSLWHNLKLLFKNKQLLLIVLSGILGGARMVYTYTGGLYFAKYVLKNEGMYSLITLLVVPGGLVASVLVPWMSKKFTKKWTYIYVHILGAVTMFIMYFVGYDAPWKLVVCAVGLVLLGIPQGVNNIITYAMIGDTVDYLEWKTGERGEGICFAMQTLINKIGMAIGAFIGVFSYQWAGINPEAANGVYITAQGQDTLWNLLILSGALSMVGTIIPMLFYKITENKQREMVAEIEERKAKAAASSAE
ncbi:MAG: glycoside-pentoside-hexuronide (GPH):cation symporter [Oscillospiraceae bacterium]|nr:glycoside-pentoside-hexuronide (GPH):cation symporter [Oscillospiraceae bacterium]